MNGDKDQRVSFLFVVGNRLCYSTFVKTRKWDPIRKRFVHDDAWLKLIQTLKLPVKVLWMLWFLYGYSFNWGLGSANWKRHVYIRSSAHGAVCFAQNLGNSLGCSKGSPQNSRNVQGLFFCFVLLPASIGWCVYTAIECCSQEAGDMVRYNILEGRQLAMKLCANSLYGFTGAKHGLLSYPPIARTVTFIGREMFEKMRTLAQSDKYKAELIYGDTGKVSFS